ncbi:MAG TPA: TetR/AcrR family transcriptional regulator [Acidimicrobiales bacterium]|nr:TetR/AcrR family transcriptional regulator [Acidimicrobiales bacterium]
MAKAGSPSHVKERSAGRSAETRRLLIQAAIETLKQEGYAGASARAIAERADSNQGLIFYHFGSVANLLLAALDAVSAERLAQYASAIARVDSPTALVDTARAIFSEDLDAGYVTVLVEMIAGAASTPGLGPEVAARIAPWTAFAEDAITSLLDSSSLAAILPPADVAYGIVALYLGLEMLSHLNGDRAPSLALFDHAQQLAGLFGVMAGNSPTPAAQ